jgi:hypothetical protein
LPFPPSSLKPTKLNYGIGEQEQLAIVHRMKVWQQHFEGLHHLFNIISDHHNLTSFQTAQVLSCHQAQWVQVYLDTPCKSLLALLLLSPSRRSGCWLSVSALPLSLLALEKGATIPNYQL